MGKFYLMPHLKSPTNPILQDAEVIFLPQLRELCGQLKSLYPNLEVDVWSWGTGSVPEVHWDLGVECVSPVAPDGEHCSTLTITFTDLITEAKAHVDLACGDKFLYSPWVDAQEWQNLLQEYDKYQQIFIDLMKNWKWNGNH